MIDFKYLMITLKYLLFFNYQYHIKIFFYVVTVAFFVLLFLMTSNK